LNLLVNFSEVNENDSSKIDKNPKINVYTVLTQDPVDKNVPLGTKVQLGYSTNIIKPRCIEYSGTENDEINSIEIKVYNNSQEYILYNGLMPKTNSIVECYYIEGKVREILKLDNKVLWDRISEK
jgi:hypothetical protein